MSGIRGLKHSLYLHTLIPSYMKRLLGCLSLAFLGACSPDKQDATSTWPTFGHDVSNNKFSALTDIDTSNVTQLREVWRYEDTTEGGGVYFNPVMMDNRVIGLMPSNKLVALDAVTRKAVVGVCSRLISHP